LPEFFSWLFRVISWIVLAKGKANTKPILGHYQLALEETISHQEHRMADMDGVLIIDKPAGMTSHDVVARVRKLTGHRRVGHTGTLDPFATGVLVILIGRATRLAQFLSGAEKEYEAVIRLGFATDTGDLTGAAIEASQPKIPGFRKEEIEVAMASLRGEIEQTPPMYSARKIAGRKLYELARRGEEIERQPMRVVISEFEFIERNGVWLTQTADGHHDLAVRVVCSAGTYIRTLAEDFGRKLGVGAHVADLRRTRAGQFKIDGAITLDRLRELTESATIAAALISTDAALSHLPAVDLSADEVARALNGVALQIKDSESEEWSDRQAVRMRNTDGDLVAVGTYDQGQQRLHPGVVIGCSSE
jgi:tRNA pseudouridine55 synthase